MMISEEFAARLETGALTTCLCWRLERSDGFVLALTEHDNAIEVDGISYQPGAALEAARFVNGTGLAPGHAAAKGALSSDAITDEDLIDGVWNGAQIVVIRADWAHPIHWVHVWSGRFSEITHGPEGFQAELVSQKADFERPIGRQYNRRCDAVLGDHRCGIDLSDLQHAGKSCDQAFATCRDRFSNTDNFRGFPHMPGADFLLAGPAGNGTDGGKR
ncbi:MAG: DUF2163 domain-containing protein [Pseudomonadota bacterium]